MTHNVTVQTPPVPTGISAPAVVNHGQSFNLTWTGPSTAGVTFKYRERLHPAIDFGDWVNVSPGAFQQALTRGAGQHDFQLQSCSAVGCSAASAFTSTIVKPPVPAAPDIQGDDDSTVTRHGTYEVVWTGDPNADGYRLYENGLLITSPAGTAVSFVNNPSGSYSYTVAACVQSQCSGQSAATPVEVSLIADLEGVEGEPVPATTSASGSIPYSFDVSSGGDGRIEIPFAVPPGVNGLAPQLGLAYSSGGPRRMVDAKAQAGILGYGWNLRGLSEIRRCRVGVGGDLHLDTSDQLCLDGQRLINVSGGYWQPGSTYRTELQSFSQIVMHGSGENAWFQVFRPDGSVATYGSAVNARVIAEGDVLPYLWSINQVVDAFGNALSVSYGIDDVWGSNYPLSISYGGHLVEFGYIGRTDTLELAHGSHNHLALHAMRSVALTRVSFYASGSLAREYTLHHGMDPSDSYLRLEGVQLCGYSEGGGSPECFAPTTFGWQQSPLLPPEFVTHVATLTDGDGNTSEFTYALLDGYQAHSLDYSESPFGSVIPPTTTAFLPDQRCAVSELKRPDGLGGIRRTTFAYKGSPHYALGQGRGFAGYYEVRRTDEDVPDASSTFDRVTYTQYRLDFPFIGRASRSLTLDGIYGSGNELARREVAWTAHGAHAGAVTFPYPAQVTNWLLEGGQTLGVNQTATDYTFVTATSASHGLITALTTAHTTGIGLTGCSVGSGVWGAAGLCDVSGTVGSTSSSATLQNWTDWMNSDWRVGFVTARSETHSAPGQTPKTTDVTLTPHGSTLAVGSMTRLPSQGDLTLALSHSYDSHGNLTEATVSGNDFTSRTTTLGSFLTNRYPEQAVNAENHYSTFAYDLRFGAVKTETDPNGLTASRSFDPFGRVISATDSEGNVTTVSYDNCSWGCSQVSWATATRRISEVTYNGSTQVAPEVVIYLDANGREVLREQEAFNGSDGWIRTETHRDTYGRVLAQSLPHFSGSSGQQYVTYAYDRQGRVVEEARPDGGVTTTHFSRSGSDVLVTVHETVATPG
ncbi:MAG: hypothetical protein JJT88_10560 [Gammaproteobacteria bacterium]|nr:hypothetical protein [Gammaproteobacteria bacterium]